LESPWNEYKAAKPEVSPMLITFPNPSASIRLLGETASIDFPQEPEPPDFFEIRGFRSPS
jgi:hypothetical protein